MALAWSAGCLVWISIAQLKFQVWTNLRQVSPFEQAACRPAMGLPLRSDKVRGRRSCGFHLICRLLLYNSLHYQICKWSAFKSNLKLKLKYQLWREVCGVQKGSPHEMPICCWQATDDSMSALHCTEGVYPKSEPWCLAIIQGCRKYGTTYNRCLFGLLFLLTYWKVRLIGNT